MAQKPRLSLWQIFNMSFGFFGIQIGFALQGGNVSRIFQTLGAKEDDIPILWLAAPLTGLLVQPIIGYFSDRTWTRFGRRRPFFMLGALLSAVALIIFPSSPTVFVAAAGLWMLDASINISMEPFRALVGDLLPNEQRNRGFATQSIIIGFGAVLGSLLVEIFKTMTPEEPVPGVVPTAVRWAFYAGAILFVLAVTYTVLTTKEYSPAEMASFEEHKASAGKEGKVGSGFWVTVAQLGLVQFFTWFALFTMWSYMTSGVTNRFYGVTDSAIQVKEFNQGADWVNIGYAVYNGVAAIFGFLLPMIANKLGRRYTHALCLGIGALGYLSFFLIPVPSDGSNSILMLGSFAMLGVAWCSILAMPYAMLSSAIPASRMGFFMGFFNFFICLPQIIASLGGIKFLKENIFGAPPINALFLSGAFMALAAVFSLFVREAKSPLASGAS
ncbi:MAG: MFS transporter [Bacteroidia bacterium]